MMKNKIEFESDFGRVPFVNGHMIGQVSAQSYFRELFYDDPEQVNPCVLWEDPYEFEATMKIVSTSPPILKLVEGGFRYQTKISELQRIINHVGIAKGGFVTSKWILKRDNMSSSWYLSLKEGQLPSLKDGVSTPRKEDD